MNVENTGKLIQDKRISMAMTQQKLAEALHVSNRTVSKWERGKGFPDVSLLEPLSEILGLSVASLLSGEIVEEPLSDTTIRRAASAFNRQMRKVTIRQVIDFCVKLLLFLAVLGFFWMMLEYNGVFNKKISMEVPVGIYCEGELIGESSVVIDGEMYRGKKGPGFGGRFAIGYVERTCREDVSCNITWDEEYGVQSIMFYGWGDMLLSSEFGLSRNIYISPNMQSFALKMSDGTIIATDQFYVPLASLDYYYSLSF